MRVALIYNPKAGAERTTGEELGDLIRAAGHDVTRHSSKDDHLSVLLDEQPELVAIAGGDGTVTKVVTIVMGRDIPLAVRHVARRPDDRLRRESPRHQARGRSGGVSRSAPRQALNRPASPPARPTVKSDNG